MKGNEYFFNKNILKKSTILFFIFFLFAGIFSVKDFGVSSDEYSSRIKGFVTLNYLGNKLSSDLTNKFKKNKDIPELKNYEQRVYGVVFEAPASLIEVILDLKDKKDQFLIRHYLNFIIFFIGVIFFYKTILLRFHSLFLSLIGSTFLVLSPRIFANSFYNNKDLVFLSFIIIASYYGIKFIKEQNLKNSIFFSLFSALAIDIRILGILIPAVVISINFLGNILEKKFKEKFLINISNLFFMFIFVIIFWPFLWEAPIENFIFAFKGMANFEIETYNLYFGEYIDAKKVEWHYIPTWILITTPVLYSVLFIFGLLIIFLKFFKFDSRNFNKAFLIDLYFLLVFIGPLIAVVIFNSTLYNGWRQLYFIYPSLIFISIIGFEKIVLFKKFNFKKYFIIFVFLYLLGIFHWIIKNHPHQYVYFNNLLPKDNLNKKFDIDYWGLSYKENFEFILENEKSQKIKIYNLSFNKLFYPLFSLNQTSRNRFVIVKNIEDADFLITNFFLEKKYSKNEILKEFRVFNEIIVDKNSINTVYKRSN